MSNITIQQEFVLYIGEDICGERLYRGENPKAKGGTWPFNTGGWMRHKTKEAAEEAARKLDAYLNAQEKKKKKK